MGFIVGAKTAFPKYRHSSSDTARILAEIWPDKKQVIEKFSKSSGVDFRNTLLPLEEYKNIKGLKKRNDLYLENGVSLLRQAITDLHLKIGFDFKDIGLIISTTITGLSVPSLEAKLMNVFDFNPNLIRIPIFGVGCLGGVYNLNRAFDYLRLNPDKLALAIAYEACTLTFQFDDISMPNLVATSLFGDGAGVVLLSGKDHPMSKKAKLEIIKTHSSFYKDTQKVMGWDIVDDGFQIVLSGNVPQMVTDHVSKDLNILLRDSNLTLDDIEFIISHPGGPKVLSAIVDVFKKGDNFLKNSFDSLKNHGNMSSVSVLNVLETTLAENRFKNHGIMLALGPAFCSELTLLKAHA